MRRATSTILILLVFGAPACADEAKENATPLFDGKTFDGWEGDLKWFRIEDGAIVAGTLEERIPRNEFLCTKEKFGDFELRLEVRVEPAATNAGVQFRTMRIPDHHEVKGYQADVGQGWWGKLYDESRRRKVLAGSDDKKLADVVRPVGWNQYVIRCQGPKIQMWLNGVQTVDYTEPDDEIARTGIIGLQIHGGPPGEARYRKITIKRLD